MLIYLNLVKFYFDNCFYCDLIHQSIHISQTLKIKRCLCDQLITTVILALHQSLGSKFNIHWKLKKCLCEQLITTIILALNESLDSRFNLLKSTRSYVQMQWLDKDVHVPVYQSQYVSLGLCFPCSVSQGAAWWKHFAEAEHHKPPLIARFMGPIWGRQDPGGPHVGPMNFGTLGH